jgi:deoxyribodipyrimidine photo-lyase
MQTAIWWIRRDVRLSDNPGLTAAIEGAAQVIPVFVLDEALLQSPYNSHRRLAFLLHGLQKLDADLRVRGARLIVRRGDPHAELTKLLHETGAGAIFAEADHSPYARQRDKQIIAQLPLHLTAGVSVQPPGTVVKADGSPYTVYTPFSRAWKALPWPGAPRLAPQHIPMPSGIESVPLEPLVHLPEESPFPAGEAEGQRRLAVFVKGSIYSYSERRDRVDLEGTSSLSPYLRFGMVSAKQAASAAREAVRAATNEGSRRSAEGWLE